MNDQLLPQEGPFPAADRLFVTNSRQMVSRFQDSLSKWDKYADEDGMSSVRHSGGLLWTTRDELVDNARGPPRPDQPRYAIQSFRLMMLVQLQLSTTKLHDDLRLQRFIALTTEEDTIRRSRSRDVFPNYNKFALRES
jgi:hypothetical protein